MADEESIGTARIDVTVNTATMETGVEAAKRKVSGLGAEAAAQFDKANASTKRYADSLLRQADMLGKSRAEQIAYNAQMKIGGDLGDQIAKKALANQEALNKATDTYVMSDKARRAAMQGVPAQVTDIVTSLASGQRPLTVLLQQGGQLKDMFGGVVPAAKALGASVLGLINPFTLLGGAAALLVVAWSQGRSEAEAFDKAIINTGNYAGQSVGSLQDMARGLALVSGTQHDASAALAEITTSGKFTSDQLYSVGAAAVAMSKVSGQAVSETVQQFAKLEEGPTKAIVGLNDQYHFLTVATYEQIKALEDQGRTQDAATLAIRTYSEVAVERANAVEGSLSNLERGWTAVKNGALGAWDAMIGGAGRSSTVSSKIQDLAEQINAVQSKQGAIYGSPDLSDASRQQLLANLRKQLADLTRQEQQELRTSYLEGSKADLTSAAIAFDQEASGYGTIEQKRAKEIAAAHTKANDLVAKAFEVGDVKLAAQIQENEKKVVAGIQDKYKSPKEKDLTIDVSDGMKQMLDQVEKNIAADKKEIEQRAKATVELMSYRDAMEKRLQTDKQALDLQVQSLGMGQHQIDLQRQLIDVQKDADRDLAKLNEPANRRTLTDDEYQARLAAIKDYEDKRTQLIYDADSKIQAARADWTNGAKRAIADIQYDAADTAAQVGNLVQSTYGSLSDFIVNAATTGKASIKDLVSSILKEVARLEANKAASALLSYGINYLVGSGYGGTGGSGGVDYNSAGFVSHVYAKGGVVDGAALSSYSNTVVDRPTTFAFARGAGLMGEAGAEAIMPLTRTADGKLGVKQVGGGASGGDGVNVSVVVNTDGSSDVSTQGDDARFGQQLGDAIKSTVKQELAMAMRPGGALWRRQTA